MLRTRARLGFAALSPPLPRPFLLHHHQFHASARRQVVKPFLLADIGEGITECQLIQWFVQPGARVEQFDKLCEVQSDKASVEITSPFDGVIKKLHYDPDDMAITGKPLVDIDIQQDLSEVDEAKLGGPAESPQIGEHAAPQQEVESEGGRAEDTSMPQRQSRAQSSGMHGSLATPAVRHLIKEHKLAIEDIEGSGRDGRVLKEDVQRHVSQGDSMSPASSTASPTATTKDRQVPLTAVQNQMYKAMTRSLHIPHFLYSTAADMTAITMLRNKLNASAEPGQKITHLAFIMKAVSLAFARHPILNATLNTKTDSKPELTYKGSHNFGIAIDTPKGLLVPVMRDVQLLSISEIALKMRELSIAARDNKLAPGDFSGATFTVSNIGSVGGGVVAPVISEPQVGILGIGRSKIVPAFNERDELVKKEELVLSWSADHRVVDGAECARCAERVKTLLEDPSAMLVDLR
ncbi:Lipoamide acyltransferase component of branched-chain alpha-keto acid dehydrogenase complex [Sphaerulina musiva]